MRWTIPNILTVLRLAAAPGVALALAVFDRPYADWIAFGLFIVAALTDWVDGKIARAWKQESNFGRMLDPIADKALMGMAFIGLSIVDVLPWWATIVVLARELAITALRFVVIRHGVMPASHGGKLKTALQALAAGLFVLPLPDWGHIGAWVVMAAAIVVTVATGIDYFFRAAKLRRESARTARARSTQS